MKFLTLCFTWYWWITSFFVTMLSGSSVFLVFIFDRKGNISHNIARFWGRMLVWLSFSRVKIVNLELRSQMRDPVIWMCNHSSFFDVYTFLGYVPGQYRIVSKEEIFQVPIVGGAMRRMGYISIKAESPKKAAEGLIKSAATIRNGKSVLIFPEGRRSETGELQPFKRGAFKLAKEAGVPLVITRIIGSQKIMQPFQKNFISRVKPGSMILEYLEIVPEETVNKLSEQQLRDHVHRIMGKE